MITYPYEDISHDIYGKPIESKGSSLIKQANIKLNLSNDHIKEYLKCQNDILYFAETYVYIVDPNKGLSKIKLYDYQKKLLKHIQKNNHVLGLMPRQAGKSTVSFIFILWYTIFNSDKTAAILANKEATATEIFSKLLNSYQYLPNYLKPGCKDFSKTQISFDNGSRVISSSTSSSSIRGYSIQCVTLDSNITIRNKTTGKIEKISIEKFINKKDLFI